MSKSKRFSYEYEEWEDGKKSAETMVADILADKEFEELDEIIIGCWGECASDSCQPILDDIVKQADKFAHIKSLFIGDMDYEECEVSWIIQGSYQDLLKALPNLKELIIKGSSDLALGDMAHNTLESLTIICGGLFQQVMESITKAKLPNLKKLNLYLGIDNYGFDGGIESVEKLLAESDFPALEYLGLNNSDIQDEVTISILKSPYIFKIHTLDLSNGTLTDKGGAILLASIPKFPNIKKLDLHYHYLSDEMMNKLKRLPVEVNLEEQEKADEYRGEVYYNVMLSE